MYVNVERAHAEAVKEFELSLEESRALKWLRSHNAKVHLGNYYVVEITFLKRQQIKNTIHNDEITLKVTRDYLHQVVEAVVAHMKPHLPLWDGYKHVNKL